MPDSAGPGQWRGGLGVEMEMEFLNDGNLVSAFGDGIDPGSEAKGILGGGSGILNIGELRYPDGTVHYCKSKEVVPAIPKGTRWYQVAGGGGGYGDPRKRSAELVAREVRYAYVSPENARKYYGVVVDAKTRQLDVKATDALRKVTA